MTLVSTSVFMMKFDFYANIPKYSKVKVINSFSDSCFIEDMNTGVRIYVNKYDIYPLSGCDNSGWWEYSSIYDEIAINRGLK